MKGKILNVEKARFDKMLSSAEVGTLITALGCGIGSDEFDPDKLRYHRIIIMTDADVDGSHIRTLLLTFFYRQMPELIERGHVYIAQPPLFKVKKGKQEQYVKDQPSLDRLLILSALDKVRLTAASSEVPIPETGEALSQQFLKLTALTERLERRFDPEVVDALLHQPGYDRGEARTLPPDDAWQTDFATLLNRNADTGASFSVALAEVPDSWVLVVTRLQHGLPYTTRLEATFFGSADYQDVVDLGALFYRSGEVRLEPESEGRETRAFEHLHAAVMALRNDSAKGITVQRYKGLGEMNPDQLRETTMDIATRNLLRVDIEDAVKADEIFSTLMGDQVEPRRVFIEQNALNVVNLDT